jgi:hypothetical protein
MEDNSGVSVFNDFSHCSQKIPKYPESLSWGVNASPHSRRMIIAWTAPFWWQKASTYSFSPSLVPRLLGPFYSWESKGAQHGEKA